MAFLTNPILINIIRTYLYSAYFELIIMQNQQKGMV